MDKEVLRTIANVEIFPVIALGIFFIFFVFMLIRVMRTDRNEEATIASIPLSDGTLSLDKSFDNHSQAH